MFTITSIDKGSICATLPIKVGDKLISINGNDVIDMLDYAYYDNIACVSIGIQRDGVQRLFKINKGHGQCLGLCFDEDSYLTARSCCNNCKFCFVRQLPTGLRSSLYVRDDDWRMSFVAGNYITLTNVDDCQIDRMVRCQFSPLYISVHSTDHQLRNNLIGNANAKPIMPTLEYLVQKGIKLHTQIVLCPDYNDGQQLISTIADLLSLGQNMLSIAVVPVGLTKFRDSLPTLRCVDKQVARSVISAVEDADNKQFITTKTHKVFCSDELYLKAQLDLPNVEFYQGFEQLENGVGLVTKLVSEFNSALQYATQAKQGQFVIVTGASASQVLQGMLQDAKSKFQMLNARVESIKNNFFGQTVTVAGLVTATDILQQLKCDASDTVLLPACMLRQDEHVFLDGITLEQLTHRLGCKVQVVEVDGYALCDMLLDS